MLGYTTTLYNTRLFLSLSLSYLRALEHAVVGCGSAFEPFITFDLLQLIFTALGHTNRFVRETGFRVLAAIVKCPGELGIAIVCKISTVTVSSEPSLSIDSQFCRSIYTHCCCVSYSIFYPSYSDNCPYCCTVIDS